MLHIIPLFHKATSRSNTEQRQWHRRQFVVFFLFSVGALLGPYVPLRIWNGCLVEKFFHIPCPVCGISSAIWMLVQGNLWKSLALHPAGIIIFVTLMLYMVYFAGAYMFGFGFSWQNEVRLKTYMDTCVFGFVGVVWLFRLVR